MPNHCSRRRRRSPATTEVLVPPPENRNDGARAPAHGAGHAAPRANETSPSSAQKNSRSYLLAFEDSGLLRRDALRPVRLQLEMWKADLILREHRIRSTVAVFGSARIVDGPRRRRTSRARRLPSGMTPGIPGSSRRSTPHGSSCRSPGTTTRRDASAPWSPVAASRIAPGSSSIDRRAPDRGSWRPRTGGARRGREEHRAQHSLPVRAGAQSLRHPGPVASSSGTSPSAKMHFLMRSKALVAFPGGFGTLDEFFEIITLHPDRVGQADPRGPLRNRLLEADRRLRFPPGRGDDLPGGHEPLHARGQRGGRLGRHLRALRNYALSRSEVPGRCEGFALDPHAPRPLFWLWSRTAPRYNP